MESIVVHGDWMPDKEFQENPLNGRNDTAEKVLCTSSKVPFIIDQSWPTFKVLQAVVAEC